MQQSTAAGAFKHWIASLDRRLYALVIGLVIGSMAGGVGLMLALLGPVVTLGALVGLLGGLYILTDLRAALYGLLALLLLLPFGTLPFSLGLTPTLVEVGLGAFLVVYLFQWMTGERRSLQLTPVHALIGLYLMWLVLAFLLGIRWGSPTATTLRDFAVMLVIIVGMTVAVFDMVRDAVVLRRLVLVIMLLVGAQAVGAIVLYALPDTLAEAILVRLSRIGYPNGGVIRYIESNPALGERAIGTWVDPNALGSVLAIGAALMAPQIFAQRPVIRWRWLTLTILALTSIALLLTSSRASLLALGAGLTVIAFARYRRFIPLLMLAGAALFLLPQTQNYVDRVFQALRGEDLATQMRIGEWTDSLELISQYPLTGIGFTGTPRLGLYTDVANMYLIMGNQIGLVGVGLYLLAMVGVFAYGWRAWQAARKNSELEAIHLGYHVALLTALVNAVADLYFFRLDFQASIAWFWLTVTLALASSWLVLRHAAEESTVAPDEPLR